MVIAVADDPGMHSSQNDQDSRHYAIAAKVPMLEPSDSQECKDFVIAAYELSEEFDTPVLIRLTTRVSHSQSIVKLEEPNGIRELKDYEKNVNKYVMMPAGARKRHEFVEGRTAALTEYVENTPVNITELRETSIGIITSGIAYKYAKESLGNSVSYLKLGIVNPLPVNLIKDFAQQFDEVIVIEELDGIIENHCKALGLTNVKGKKLFGFTGELSQRIIAEKILGQVPIGAAVPVQLSVSDCSRPPVMCAGCPHRGVFRVLSKLNLFVSGDIGCYTLGANSPLSAMDTTVCMGASVSALHGYNKVRNSGKAVAVIGDSTFIHSGITGLINASYNASASVVIILDNSITGMTGHQQNPATGFNLQGEPAVKVNLEALIKAIGIDIVRTVDAYDMNEVEQAVLECLKTSVSESDSRPAVIIARRPCVLLKNVPRGDPLSVLPDKCISCKMCMKIGCPAVSMKDNIAQIDSASCTGCGVCRQMCKSGAIVN
jgi:indolepyruvate ferredoxin oxidoreductase alpha subunit